MEAVLGVLFFDENLMLFEVPPHDRHLDGAIGGEGKPKPIYIHDKQMKNLFTTPIVITDDGEDYARNDEIAERDSVEIVSR